MSDPAANKALVVKAITELFIDGDASARHHSASNTAKIGETS